MQATRKIPGGKLLSIEISLESNKIKAIRITGDFFMHPENTIIELEKKLAGKKLEYEPLLTHIKAIFEKHTTTLVGIGAADIASLIIEAGAQQ
jgi:lipoate-protein ligase A